MLRVRSQTRTSGLPRLDGLQRSMEAEAEYFLAAVSDSHFVVSEKPKQSPFCFHQSLFQTGSFRLPSVSAMMRATTTLTHEY